MLRRYSNKTSVPSTSDSLDAVSPGDAIVVVDTVCDQVYFVGVFIILCWLSQMIRGFCGRFLVCLREIGVMFESQRGLSC